MHGMSGSRSSFAAFSVSALTLILAPSVAIASTHSDAPSDKSDHAAREHACSKPSVEIVAGPESATLPLERCDGKAIPASVEKLSILARPANTAKPKESLVIKPHGAEVAPGIRRIDARLAERLELVADHFHKDGEATRIILVAPKSRSAGSYHASGRAIDFRIEGADDEAVAAFCKTVPDTGCGFYPNGGFVHMDVRDAGAGHVSWIDISKAGETPKYVSAWPLPADVAKAGAKTEGAKTEAKESAKIEAKVDSAKCEAKPEGAQTEPTREEAPKAEASKQADNTDDSKLPSLPAAVQVAPMDPPAASSELAPVKKHRHHKKSHSDHSI
jgi:hypothetical protein